MAAKTAVGSAAWIAAEKENIQQLLSQEKEELVFPAQHEIEWLNEHMADIFSKSHVEMANVFKTPGKLRGKTPRTTRKRNVPEARIPLSDVFSSQPYQRTSPAKATNNTLRFAVAEDEVATSQQPPAKSQTDSGYQGSSQIDEETNAVGPAVPPKSPLRTIKSPVIEEEEEQQEQRTTDGSFHSAKEDQTAKLNAQLPNEPEQEEIALIVAQQEQPIQEEPLTLHPDFSDIGSPSDESTPDRPVVRKGSMTFASLPAREPLKTSIGNRVSRTSHIDPSRSFGPSRDSHYSRQPSTAAPARPSHVSDHEDDNEDDDVDMDDSHVDDSHIEILGVDDSVLESESARQYSRATTQRLHDRIDMLGKGPEPRPSKSIPSAAALAALRRSAEEHEDTETQGKIQADEEDDWIKPLKEVPENEPKQVSSPTHEDSDMDDAYDVRAPELIAHEERMNAFRSPSPQRPGYGHTKSASTATLASPAKAAMAPPPSPAKSASGTYPAFESTTPAGSPKRFMDGTLSASKSKFQSIMSSAKGLFTKSASISATAKMDSFAPQRPQTSASNMPGMYPSLDKLDDKPLPPSPPEAARKTRSSTEREKEEKRKERDVKAMQKMNDDLDKARQKEQQKAIQKHQVQEKPQSPKKNEDRQELSETTRSTQPAKVGRPVRPNRDAPKAKPQPVSIRIGTLSQRMPVNQAPVATHNQETLTSEPKRPGLNKKASNQSISSSSTATFKTSVTAQQPAKPKALLAAERKKEQDEREAQRKLEHKKEMERKRAVMQEEARKKEQREREEAERKERERVAEQQRKRQAQQDAIEKKRQDAVRKAEQQKHERPATQEAQPNRPPSRLGQQNVSRPIVNHHPPTNPAKPPKRQLEDENSRPQAPRFGAASQQADAKRRKTEDEQREQPPRPTISGAPIRQSQLGKKPSMFNHPSYSQAPGPSHLGQFPQPPNRAQPQMQHFATAKIPFAEPPNPPSKTPISSIRTIQAVKSSPQYPNGDSIHLPEIPTDSEDEDSEDEGNAFPLPDWATPGHLTEQLIRQEGMDGDAVFGPIAPLRMEEIFAKGNKDRLKKLRDRTSSANWAMSGDGLTLEEVRVDREQRERMRVEGGWRYGS